MDNYHTGVTQQAMIPAYMQAVVLERWKSALLMPIGIPQRIVNAKDIWQHGM